MAARDASALPAWLKPALWLVCLAPLATLVAGLFLGTLGANPVETITHETGEAALYALALTLAVTPLRRATGWHALLRVRRLLGLFAFFYACMHFATWAVLDHSLALRFIVEDIVERPYVTAGFVGLVLMLPLALTSTRAMQRRLGGRRWLRLHRAVYIVAVAALTHLVWQARVISAYELAMLALFAVLLGTRLPALSARLPALRSRSDGAPT